MNEIENLNSRQLCKDWYLEYAAYVNSSRSIPGLDGLKMVQRRILTSLNSFSKNTFHKTLKISGHCIGNYHPHGNTSVEEAISTMVKNGQIIGQGSWGSFLLENLPAASPRYTEVKFAADKAKYYFELEKYAVHKDTFSNTYECVNLPIPIPEALIYGTEGIAIGVSCKIPGFTKESLFEALKCNDPRPLKVNASDIDVLDFEARKLWETGKGSITFSFRVKKEWSKLDNQEIVVIEGNGRFFKPRYRAVFKNWIEEGFMWIRDESSKNIRLVFGRAKNIRKINIDGIFEKAVICAKKKFSYEIKIWDYRDGCVKAIGIGKWLFECYADYKRIFDIYKEESLKLIKAELYLMSLVPSIYPEFSKQRNLKSIEEIAAENSIEKEIVEEISNLPVKYGRKDYRDKKIDNLTSKLKDLADKNCDLILGV